MRKCKKNVVLFIILGLILFILVFFLVKRNSKKVDYSLFPKYDDYVAAKNINSDTIGWIYIPKTNINYPIMVSRDYDYIDYSFEKVLTTSGAIHIYSDELSQNIVLTGHNSRVGMFRFNWLHHLKDVNTGLTSSCIKKANFTFNAEKMPNFNNSEDRIWYISICNIIGKWEVWSFYQTPVDEPVSTSLYNFWETGYSPKSKTEIKDWIDFQISRSEFNFNTIPSEDDKFLTIFTCACEYSETKNEARLYYFLRKVA